MPLKPKMAIFLSIPIVIIASLLGPFIALFSQAVALIIISSSILRGTTFVDQKWRELRIAVPGATVACLMTMGLMLLTLFRTEIPLRSLIEVSVPLLLFTLLLSPLLPLWRRYLPTSTLATSTAWGLLLFALFYTFWPWPSSWELSLPFFFVLLMWVECGYIQGLILLGKGIHKRTLMGRDRIFQEYITIWCILLLHGVVIFRHLIYPLIGK